MTIGNGQTYTRTIDLDGRIAGFTLAGSAQTLGFDAASRIRSATYFSNPLQLLTYDYDVLDRLIFDITPTTASVFSYDANGNRTSKTVGASTWTYAYPASNNKLASITAGAAKTYVHDADGAITSDATNTFTYDTRGRLVQAATALGSVTYGLNSLGQRYAKTVPGSGGGSTQVLFSDAFAGPQGRAIDDQADGLWKGGGKQTAARSIGGQAEIAPGRHIRTSAAFSLPSEGLVLRAKLARGKVALLNVAQDEGLIVRYAGNSVAVARARDDDGADLANDANVRARFALASPGALLQLTMELKPGSARVRIAAGAQRFDTGEIALDAVQPGERYRIRLAAVKRKGIALSGLIGDVQLTTMAGAAPLALTTHFLYDAQARLIGEYTGQGALIREYAYLQDLPLALFEPSGAVLFVHTDHLNTPRVITDQNRRIVWRWDNDDAFGGNMANENPSGLGAFTFNLRFPGQYFDKETNLHYNYFRDYSPEIGRYIESDPIGVKGGINTYSYVRNNPILFIDPQGTETCGVASPTPQSPFQLAFVQCNVLKIAGNLGDPVLLCQVVCFGVNQGLPFWIVSRTGTCANPLGKNAL